MPRGRPKKVVVLDDYGLNDSQSNPVIEVTPPISPFAYKQETKDLIKNINIEVSILLLKRQTITEEEYSKRLSKLKSWGERLKEVVEKI